MALKAYNINYMVANLFHILVGRWRLHTPTSFILLMGKPKLEMLGNYPDLFMLECSDPGILIALTIMEDS